MPSSVERPASSSGEPGHPPNPFESFARELDELKTTADRLMRLLSIPVWSGDEAKVVDETLRQMRRQLPAHFLREEHILFPEMEAAGLLTPKSAKELRRRHLAVEGNFVEVQDLALALGVGGNTRSLRRQILRAARRFRQGLDDLLRSEESGLIASGSARLAPDALARLRDALAAASQRENLKELQFG